MFNIASTFETGSNAMMRPLTLIYNFKTINSLVNRLMVKENKDLKSTLRLDKLSLKLLTIVASTSAVYELLLHDLARSAGFGICWLIFFIAARRINSASSDSRD